MQEESYGCQEVVQLLSDYIDDECAPGVRSLVDAHLADCPNCMAFVNTLRKSVAMTKALDYSDIPEDVRTRLHRVLERQIPVEGAPPEIQPPPFDRRRTKIEDEDRY